MLYPKLNFYCLNLPNPSDQFVKNLTKLFYNFIWSSKPDKIKRVQLCNDYSQGGLKMFDIRTFMESLKLTWIRRLYNNNNNSKWCVLFDELNNLGNIFNTSVDVILRKLNMLNNSFWVDVIMAWVKLQGQLRPHNVNDFLCLRLWNNSLIRMGGNTIAFKCLKSAGIYFVNDLFDNNGDFYEYNEFCRRFKVNINVLHFTGLKKALENIFDFSNITCNLNMPLRPYIFRVLLNSTKGCQDFYNILKRSFVQNNSSIKSKWEDDLNVEISEKEWIHLNSFPFKCLQSTKLRWFHYRLVNRILGTNTVLFKMGIRDSDLCTFCSCDKETYDHLFFFCSKVSTFISDVFHWILNNTNIRLHLNAKALILGCNNSCFRNNILNVVLINLKFFIYKCRCDNTLPTIHLFKFYLKSYWESEKYVFYASGRGDKFVKLWEDWSPLFID